MSSEALTLGPSCGGFSVSRTIADGSLGTIRLKSCSEVNLFGLSVRSSARSFRGVTKPFNQEEAIMSTTTDTNVITFTGHLVRDPELRHLSDGRPVCNLRVAVNGSGTAVTFIDVATFGKSADVCAQYLSKGRRVSVTGQLIYREWTASNGAHRSKHSVIGRVSFGPQSAGSK